MVRWFFAAVPALVLATAAAAVAAEGHAVGAAGRAVVPLPEIRLQAYEMCAGSPLTVGVAITSSATVENIHVVVNPHDVPVGWIYEASSGASFLQANEHMSRGDQATLGLSAGEAVSSLRPKPRGLPLDLNVRPCLRSEITSF